MLSQRLKEMKKLLYTFLILCVALAVFSCSSSKGVAVTPVDMEGTGETADVSSLARALADKGNWQVMKIPVNVALRKPVSAKLGGTMTLVRGDEIRLSLRFFGMEVAAASITGDSVRAYVKMQKIYVAESLDKLLGGFPATVDNVQSLLLGRIFEVGASSPDFRRCKVSALQGSYTVTPPRASGGLSYMFTANTEGNTLGSLEMSGKTGHDARVDYSYPRNNTSGFPEEIALSGNLKDKTVEARIEYSLNNIDRSASAPGKFSIPKGYRRISASSLLKLLDSLK